MFYQSEHIGTADYFKKEEGENFTYQPHLHGSFELILVRAGEMEVTVDGTSYLLRPGRGVLIFPNQIHSIQSKSSRHTLFIFSPRLIQAFIAEKNGKLPQNNTFNLPPSAEQMLLALSPQDSKYALKGAMYQVCALFEQEAEYAEALSDQRDLLFRIFSYVEEHFKSDCTLDTLSGALGYHADYLSRFFKKKAGIPYNQYLNTRRLSHAAHLLVNTNETCLYCALESGYSSLRSFNRNFKAHFGIAPKTYKLQNTPK